VSGGGDDDDGGGILDLICDADIAALQDKDMQLMDEDARLQGEIDAIPAGPHTVDTDTHLTEAEVDAFVANNGFSTGPHTASLPWTSITGIPAGFADNIDDEGTVGSAVTDEGFFSASANGGAIGLKNTVDMIPVVTGKNTCFLTRVGTVTGGTHSCDIIQGSVLWKLEAIAGSGVSVSCFARCLSWD